METTGHSIGFRGTRGVGIFVRVMLFMVKYASSNEAELPKWLVDDRPEGKGPSA